MQKIAILTLVCLFLCGCARTEEGGPLERAGASVDRTVDQVAAGSVEIAAKTASGAKNVTRTVGEAVEQAGEWVQRKSGVERTATEPTPTVTPSPVPKPEFFPSEDATQ